MQSKLLSLLIVLMLFPLTTVFGQSSHIFVVPPYRGTGSAYLNDIINGDTLATGKRRDSLAVYVLRRDSIYLQRLVIQNNGYKLTMQAEDGKGYRPIIYLYPGGTNNLPPGQCVNAKGDVTFKNLCITGFYEPGTYDTNPPDTSFLGGMQGGLFDFASPGFNVTIDSCILSNCNGNHIRTSSVPLNVKITNTVFANMGYLGRSNLGAGKGVDVRAGSVDTLIIQNCTFVNSQDRIIRHFASTAPIKYLNFDHNTIINSMGYHGIFSLGKTSQVVNITNNLLVDPFALGEDTDTTRQAEFTDSGEKDAAGKARMTWVISNPDTTTKFYINNNYYTISDSGKKFYADYAADGVKGEGSPLTWNIAKKVADSTKAFQKITLSLTKTPVLMTNMMRWYRTPLANGGAGKTKDTKNFDKSKYDYDRKRIEWLDGGGFDCTYSTSSVAYSGAVGGFPVGDLNWYPAKKSQWALTTDVRTDKIASKTFELLQNYPNPFNPTTKISFVLDRAESIKLTIYNVLGQKVATLYNGPMAQGFHEMEFDASQYSSGVYIYKLEAGNMMQTRKMMLLK
jgi:hypothetical protein